MISYHRQNYEHGHQSREASCVAFFEAMVAKHPKLFARAGMRPAQKRQQVPDSLREVSRAEVEEMVRLKRAGKSVYRIARVLKRAEGTVERWLVRARRGKWPKEGAR